MVDAFTPTFLHQHLKYVNICLKSLLSMKAEKEVVFGYKGRVMNGIDLSGSFKTLKCQKIIGRKNTELMVLFITHVAVG